MTGRLTVGLYNSYDRLKLAEAHRRAIARAGALCWAFDANLATLGFPFDRGARAADAGPLRTPGDVAAWVAASTTIGEEGTYLRELAEAGRIDVFDLPDPGFPPQLGTPVATTRQATDDKARTADQLAASLAHDESLLVVFGLGPRGLPDEVRETAPRHFDVTGRGLSLETATAMGAVVGQIALARRHHGGASSR